MSLETLSHTPSSRDLLDQLTRTVKDRWAEFNAVINAPDFLKNTKPEYVEMKQNYTLIMTELSKLSSDTELRSNQAIRSHMEDFLSKVSAYMASPDAEAKYRPTLERAQSEIADLKRQIYIEQAQQSRAQSKEQVSAQTASRLEQVAVPTTAAGAVALESSRAATPSTPAAPASTTSQSPSRPGDESAQKGNTWLDKISHFGDVWDLATKVKEKSGFFAAASFFFATIFAKDKIAEMASKYGIEVPKMNDSDSKVPEEKSVPENSSTVSMSLIAMRKIHSEQIQKYSEEARKGGEAILTNPHFLDLPFMEYREMMKTGVRPDGLLKQSTVANRVKLHEQIDKNILPKLGLPSSKANYEAVMYALSVIYPYTDNPKNNSLQDAVYSKITPQETIRDVMGGSVVHDLSHAYQLARLDLTDVSKIGQTLQPGVFIENGEIKGDQADQLRTQFSTQTLKSVLLKSSAPFPSSQFTQAEIDKDTQLQGASLDELNKLVTFRKQLVDSLIGADWVYQLENTLLNKATSGMILKELVVSEAKNMSYAQVLRYYAILGGNGDTSKQNGIQKFMSHGILTNLVDQSRNDEAIGRMIAINGKLVRQEIVSSNVNIPDDIKNIFQNVLGSTQEKMTGTMGGWLEQFWAMFKTAPIEATVMSGALGVYAIFGKWLPAKDGSVYDRYLK